MKVNYVNIAKKYNFKKLYFSVNETMSPVIHVEFSNDYKIDIEFSRTDFDIDVDVENILLNNKEFQKAIKILRLKKLNRINGI